MKETLDVIQRMRVEGIIGAYAIGGAVGATFYLKRWTRFERRFLDGAT